jgi:hypothetical protein
MGTRVEGIVTDTQAVLISFRRSHCVAVSPPCPPAPLLPRLFVLNLTLCHFICNLYLFLHGRSSFKIYAVGYFLNLEHLLMKKIV